MQQIELTPTHFKYFSLQEVIFYFSSKQPWASVSMNVEPPFSLNSVVKDCVRERKDKTACKEELQPVMSKMRKIKNVL